MKARVLWAALAAVAFVPFLVSCNDDDDEVVRVREAVELSELGMTFEAVDLGLPSGTKWATCNLGASTPEEYGSLYQWGDPNVTSDTVGWSNYKWCDGDWSALTKYCKQVRYGGANNFTDDLTVLENEDDAAVVALGGTWRMPTYDDFVELTEECTWEWKSLNGVEGYMVKSKIKEYKDRWLFFPASGYQDGGDLYGRGLYGNYWSASLFTKAPRSARYLYFSGNGVNADGFYYRCCGFAVRPVSD